MNTLKLVKLLAGVINDLFKEMTVIVTSSGGGGHLVAAKNLQETLLEEAWTSDIWHLISHGYWATLYGRPTHTSKILPCSWVMTACWSPKQDSERKSHWNKCRQVNQQWILGLANATTFSSSKIWNITSSYMFAIQNMLPGEACLKHDCVRQLCFEERVWDSETNQIWCTN